MSTRRPLFRLLLTGNHRRLRQQWCDERWIWSTERNDIVFTEVSRFCLQHHDGQIRVWRHHGYRLLNSCIVHRPTHYQGLGWYWISLPHPSSTHCRSLNSQRYISEVLEPMVLPFIQSLPSTIFLQDELPHSMCAARTPHEGDRI
ncbi:transposable element Tcb1 transposase [Trichonephila clavipes]|nr:transposable element Tcb1 transposase [Trichonephila clavipes]